MKKQKWTIFFAVLLIVVGLVYFCRDPSELPLDVDNATSVRFSIIPQDNRNCTVTDDDRVKEIVCVINELDLEEGTKRPNRTSNNYYYFGIHIGAEDVAVELDEYIISINNEIYQTDTLELCALLERTCYDVMEGIIE